MKSGMLFSFFFRGRTRKKKYLFYKKKKRKEKKRRFFKKCGNWDLISLPCGSSFIHFFFFLSFYFSNIVLYIQLKVCKVLKLDKKQSKTHTLLQQAINTDPLYQCGSLTLTRSFTRIARASW